MFYGWRIVAICAFAQAVSTGTTYYAYGAFMKPLAADFDASRLAVTLGMTSMGVVQGLAAPFLGRGLDRLSPRFVLATGVVLEALGLGLLSRATELWQAGLLLVSAIALGSYLFGALATTAVVGRWFVRRRGRALGLTALGSAAGGVAFPPIVTALIGELGWRGAAGALGAGILLLVVPILLFVARRPEDVGALPDGDAYVASGSDAPADPNTAAEPLPTRTLLADRNFRVITIAMAFAYCPVNVMLAHLVPFATDIGISPARAAILLSGYAFGSALGRLPFGWLVDRFDKKIAAWVMFGWFAASWSQLMGQPSFEALLAAVVAAGFAVGGTMPLWGALTGAAFGRASIGSAMGLTNLLMLPVSIAGAPIAAHLYDRTGSYQLAFTIFIFSFAVGAIAIAFLRLPAVEPGTAG
ncbi:MAG: MFS transporter [Deltaproteobacteria bacterium]|nr:MFS transporter [Deltaproteobacteria bacterium]